MPGRSSVKKKKLGGFFFANRISVINFYYRYLKTGQSSRNLMSDFDGAVKK